MTLREFSMGDIKETFIPDTNQTVWSVVKTQAGIQLCVAEAAINNINVNSPVARDEVQAILVTLIEDLGNLGVKKPVTAIIDALFKQMETVKEAKETPSILLIFAIEVMTDIRSTFSNFLGGIEPTRTQAHKKLLRMGFKIGN